MTDGLDNIPKRNWWEKCDFIYTFHLEKQDNHGNNKRGDKWKIEDTASALELSMGYVSESIKLAKAIRKTPELKGLTREMALFTLKEREL